MKKLLILLTFLGLGVVSCTKENSSDSAEALILTSDVATHYEGESFKFTVKSTHIVDINDSVNISSTNFDNKLDFPVHVSPTNNILNK